MKNVNPHVSAAVKTMCAATRTYLKNPDPVGWLALADAYEEEGQASLARTWRARGRWFPALLDALGRAHAELFVGTDVRVFKCVVSFRRERKRSEAAPEFVVVRFLRPGLASVRELPSPISEETIRFFKGRRFQTGGHAHNLARRHRFVIEIIDALGGFATEGSHDE